MPECSGRYEADADGIADEGLSDEDARAPRGESAKASVNAAQTGETEEAQAAPEPTNTPENTSGSPTVEPAGKAS
ncbi:hypothetical protein GCM10027176_20750 [Actinoallomurus bryophytorum]